MGTTVIAPRFSLVSSSWKDARRCASVHFIDSSGQQAFSGEFGDAERFSEARAYVIASPRRYGFINVEGNIVIGARPRAAHFSEGRALVYAGKYAGFVDPRVESFRRSLAPGTASARGRRSPNGWK